MKGFSGAIILLAIVTIIIIVSIAGIIFIQTQPKPTNDSYATIQPTPIVSPTPSSPKPTPTTTTSTTTTTTLPQDILVEDLFGRVVNQVGITLVDWEGYISNPAMKYFLNIPTNFIYPLTIELSSIEPRMYFDSPSEFGPTGAEKIITVESKQKVPFYISIFPDRDIQNEVHSLTAKITDATGVKKVSTIPVRVIDQDKNKPLLFPVITDFSRDKTGFFNHPLKREIAKLAAEDWFYFFADMELVTVPVGNESKWIWDVGSCYKDGQPVTNSFPYKGFLLYVYGVDCKKIPCVSIRSGGGPSDDGFQLSKGAKNLTPLPLRRSGDVSIEIKGDYACEGWQVSKEDKDWWAWSRKAGPKDFYSVMEHELAHAIIFHEFHTIWGDFKTKGLVDARSVVQYHKTSPYIDACSHLRGSSDVDRNCKADLAAIDRISRKGAYGSEFFNWFSDQPTYMPAGRWIFTKLDLLVANAIGYKLRATSPFILLSIVKQNLPEGMVNKFYSAQLNAKGGIPPYHWSVESESLPDGLLFNSFTGVISGVPTKIGTYNFIVRLRDYDEAGSAISLPLRIKILPM